MVDLSTRTAALATVRRDALVVRQFELEAGVARYVATYERDEPSPDLCDKSFNATTAEQACRFVLSEGVFADFERPVLAACALEGGQGLSVASMQHGQEEAVADQS